eukprot:Tbor_TRINITY_DN2355_c0_g1::TRINITY_DN2355_c0_g1_i1::g.179::m.179
MYSATSFMQFRRQATLPPPYYSTYRIVKCIHQRRSSASRNNDSSYPSAADQYKPGLQYDLSTKGFPGSDFTPNTQLSGEGGIWDDGINGYEWKRRYLEEKRSLANTYMNDVSRRTPIHEAVKARARTNRERLMRPLGYRYTAHSSPTAPSTLSFDEEYYSVDGVSSSHLGRERTGEFRPSSLLAEALKIHHCSSVDSDYVVSGSERSVQTTAGDTESEGCDAPHSSSYHLSNKADVSGLFASNRSDEGDSNSGGFLLMMDEAEGDKAATANHVNIKSDVRSETDDEGWITTRQKGDYASTEGIQSRITKNLSSNPGSQSVFAIQEQNQQKVRDAVDLVEEELDDLLSDEKCIAALSALSEEDLAQLRNEFFIEGINGSGCSEAGPGLPTDGLPDSDEEMLREWGRLRTESSICHSYAGVPAGERREWSPWYLRDIRSNRRYN